MNRNALAVVSLCCCCMLFHPEIGRAGTDPQATDNLAPRLDAVLHRLDGTGAVFAARVVDLSNGRELYARDADRPMMPASNGKLANDASGLDHFGPDHRFVTYLAIDGDDLWLIGTGDPGCGDPDLASKHHMLPTTMLDDWSQALRARGIRRIPGKLYYYDGTFDDEWIAPTWYRGYLTDWYAAPISGLTFNDNCIDATLVPGEPGQPARVEVMPPNGLTQIIDDARTASAGGGADQGTATSISREADKNAFTVRGTIARQTKLESKPITDPGAFFADALRTNLAAHGITIAGAAERASREAARQKWGSLVDRPLLLLDQDDRAPTPDLRVVAVHTTPMSEVLGRINKNSQNLFAEAMCKMQGRDWNLAQGRDDPGTWAAGSEAVHDFLRRQGIDDSHYVLVDGSGLSRDNRVTARLITDLLCVMSKHRYAEAFRQSLTICGVDGTLRKRMNDIAGLVRGKTGSIGGVRTLSGYATTRSGRTLTFSFLFNEADGNEQQCERIEDDACRVLVEWPNVARLPTTMPSTRPPN